MTPHSFTIRGALGIRAGMGRDAITVDLDAIVPGDARQVAIVGDNGSGKTTLMTLGMNPWREPNGVHGSVYDQFGPEGRRCIIWSHDGTLYRSDIEYKNGKTKAQKASLYYKDGIGAWAPVTLPDNTVSDGKTRTYDACLRHILGPQEIYYVCAAKTQGAPKIAEHADAKGLLRALLDLDYVDALQDRAKGIRREWTRRRDTLRAAMNDLDAVPAQIEEAKQGIAEINAGASERSHLILECDHTLSMAKAQYDAIVAQDYERLDLVRRRQEAQARFDEVMEEYRAKWKQAKAAERAAQAALATIETENEKVVAAIDNDIEAAGKEINEQQAILDQRAQIEKAQTDLEALQQEMQGKRAELDDLDERIAKAAEIDRVIAKYESEIAAENREIDTLRAALEDLKRRHAFVEQVPCLGQGQYAKCPALADAQAAGHAILGKEKAIAGCHAGIAEIDKHLQAQRAQRDALADATTEARNGLRTIIAGLQQRVSEIQRKANLSHRLEAAEQAIERVRARLEGLVRRRDEAMQEWERKRLDARTAIHSASGAVVLVEEEGKARVATAQKALDAIPAPGSGEAVDQAMAALVAAETAAQDARNAANEAQARKASLVERIALLTEQLHAGQKQCLRLRALDDEIAHWDLLAKGLQGVVDLSIEAAGPSIAGIANTILAQTFGGRFALRIITQKELANGKMVETLDISVLDSDTDSEASILHKSGGESVWLDAALSLAVALYQQDVSGRRYETRFSDESDDGLAAGRKRLYYQMSRVALDLGGYEREYFVSHHPDAAVWADAIIDVARLV